MTVGMLRVKNESRWIAAVLQSILPVCDRIAVLDDHSTDATAAICRTFGCSVLPSPFNNLDESRDKNYLLEAVMGWNPQWVLAIDGDEVLESDGPKKIDAAIQSSAAGAYSFRVLYLWNSMDVVRVDGVYGRFSRPSLFRAASGQRFKTTQAGGHFHCGNVPQGLTGPSCSSGVCLLHLGYMYREDRIRKFEWYRSIDGDNLAEDGYRHMVIGDLFPRESRFKHAGPLETKRLAEVLPCD